MDYKKLDLGYNENYDLFQKRVNIAIRNHYSIIESRLRELKEKEAPELTDEEFAKMWVVEEYFEDKTLHTVVRLKTVEEILKETEAEIRREERENYLMQALKLR